MFRKPLIVLASLILWAASVVAQTTEAGEVEKEIQLKEQDIYTPEQLRIRAANKLVKKARKTYFKRKQLTDEDVTLIATYMKAHIEAKMKSLLETAEEDMEILTPLEQPMTLRQRVVHRRRRAVAEKALLMQRKRQAEIDFARRATASKELSGPYEPPVIKPSIRRPVRIKKVKKKKKAVTEAV